MSTLTTSYQEIKSISVEALQLNDCFQVPEIEMAFTNGVGDVLFPSSSLHHGRVSASGFALVIPSYLC